MIIAKIKRPFIGTAGVKLFLVCAVLGAHHSDSEKLKRDRREGKVFDLDDWKRSLMGFCVWRKYTSFLFLSN